MPLEFPIRQQTSLMGPGKYKGKKTKTGIKDEEKMLENRPDDALGSLLDTEETVQTVKTVETVKPAETEETVETACTVVLTTFTT